MERHITGRTQEINRSLVPDFASFYGEPILPPSVEGRGLTQEQFRGNFPVRHLIWHQLNDYLRDPNLASPLGNTEESDRLRTRLHLLNRFDRYATIHNREPGSQILRPRQLGVFASIHDALEKGENEATIQAPTGLGKTVIFGQVVAAADVPSLIVVPTQFLVEQTYESFKKFAPHVDIGRVYEEEKETARKVIITTYSTLVTDKKGKLLNPDGTKLIILDEAHEGLSDKRIEKIETVEGFKDAVILSFSATPVRINDPRINEKRVVKASRNLIHEISERESIEEGYLSPFTGVRVEVDVDLSEVPTNKNGDYDEDDLDKKLNTQVQNEAALQFFKEVRKRDRAQSIKDGKPISPLTTSVYASSIAHAQQLSRVFSEAGISAAAVWGDQDDTEKDEVMKKWASGEIEAVFSKDLLVRGLDLPKIRMIMSIAPTNSPIVEKQRSGRGLRLDPENPDKHAIIADFVYINTKSANTQVTYPELLGSAQIVKRVGGEEGIEDSSHRRLTGLDGIEIEGLKVITNPEDVMTILNRIKQENESKSPPPGWKVMGQKGLVGTLAYAVGRKPDAIASQIHNILSELEAQAREQSEPFFPSMHARSYTNKVGRPSIFYSPELESVLVKRMKPLEKPPEGWRLLGERRMANSLSGILEREASWVLNKLRNIEAKIKRNLLEQGIPIPDQDPLVRRYQSLRGPADFYAPIIFERLREIINSETPPPEGWYSIGEGEQGTLTGVLKKSAPWVVEKAAQIIDSFKEEWEKQEIPVNEQPNLSGQFTQRSRLVTFYSPLVFEGLQELSDKMKPAPQGWMTAGQWDKSGISKLINKSPDWVRHKAATVIEMVMQKWKNDGLPEQQWPQLVGEFGMKGLTTYYSPEVIRELKEIVELEEIAPPEWMAIGDKTNENTIASILSRDRRWAETRIPGVIEQIEQELDKSKVPSAERPRLTGEFVAKNGSVFTFYSPLVIKRLIALHDSQPKPPSGWLTVSNDRRPGTISGVLDAGRIKVLGLIREAISKIEGEYEERGIPPNERPNLHGEFYTANGRGIYYSPEVVEKAIQLKNQS